MVDFFCFINFNSTNFNSGVHDTLSAAGLVKTLVGDSIHINNAL